MSMSKSILGGPPKFAKVRASCAIPAPCHRAQLNFCSTLYPPTIWPAHGHNASQRAMKEMVRNRGSFCRLLWKIVRPPRSEGFLFKGVANFLTNGGKKTLVRNRYTVTAACVCKNSPEAGNASFNGSWDPRSLARGNMCLLVEARCMLRANAGKRHVGASEPGNTKREPSAQSHLLGPPVVPLYPFWGGGLPY